jgi:hypothetical protein
LADLGSGNSRNGKRSKTVVTEVGPVDIEVPRDRERWAIRWKPALNAFALMFEGRIIPNQ